MKSRHSHTYRQTPTWELCSNLIIIIPIQKTSLHAKHTHTHTIIIPARWVVEISRHSIIMCASCQTDRRGYGEEVRDKITRSFVLKFRKMNVRQWRKGERRCKRKLAMGLFFSSSTEIHLLLNFFSTFSTWPDKNALLFQPFAFEDEMSEMRWLTNTGFLNFVGSIVVIVVVMWPQFDAVTPSGWVLISILCVIFLTLYKNSHISRITNKKFHQTKCQWQSRKRQR